MKKTVFTGICLLLLTAASIIGCNNDEQDVATTNSLEVNLKANVRDFDSLLKTLYGSSYRVGQTIKVTDANDTYTLTHITTLDGSLEGYTIKSSKDNAYIEHNARLATVTNYTNDSGQAEGIYDMSNNLYYLDHGFTPILVQDPGQPTPVVYGKKLSYGACSPPDANGNSFAGVYVTRNFLGLFSGEPKAVMDGSKPATVPCGGNPLHRLQDYTGDY